jgi:predicted anti-sigma-YlaC factor YlaD
MTPEECKRVFEMLSEYLDGGLPENVCEEVGEHIGDCPPCIAFVESLKKTKEVASTVLLSNDIAPLPEVDRERLRAAWKKAVAFRREGSSG